MRDLILIGASGLAREVASAAEGSGWRVVGVLDDDESLHGTSVGGLEVLGATAAAAARSEQLLVCIGAGTARRAVVDRLSLLGVGDERYATFVEAGVRVPPTVAVAPGSIVLGRCVLTADLRVGRHVVLMPGVVLTHDDRVADFVTLAAGVSLGGGVVLEAECYLGMNSSVRQHTTIGAAAVVGMGAAVVGDIPAGETWAGVPARRLSTTGEDGKR